MMCPRCNSRPKKKHRNAKWCAYCAEQLIKRPDGKLTPAQERKVRRLAGTMFVKDLAKEVGTSKSNLTRWAKQHGVNINALRYPDHIVQEVCDYYAKHGGPKTQKKYPKIRIRSIVERYFKRLGHEPRQVRWTADEIIELAKMGGLVSYERQAAYFNRPGANKGSITSAWAKKFGHGSVYVNGLSMCIAKHYVRSNCPYYKTSFWDHHNGARNIALWVDVEKHLRSDVPDHLRDAIKALAKFQRWLHGRNVRQSIKRILEERG